MRNVRRYVLVLAGCLGATAAGGESGRTARAEDAPSNSVPFPLTGRQTVRAGGKTYVIDGKQVIAGNSVIRVEANVRIVGINNASLEVQGGLHVHGTQDCWVHIEKVDFSPTVAPASGFHLDMADLHDCKLVHGEAAKYDGTLTIENSCWQSTCKFAARIRSGFLRIMTVEFKMPCVVDCTPEKGKLPEVAIRTAWMKDVTLTGSAATTIRNAEVRGTLAAKGFTDLVIDGCDLFGNVALEQGAGASFGKLQLLKCNLFGGSTLAFKQPADGRTKPERVRVDKWHFGTGSGADLTDKAIAERIQDCTDDASIFVKAVWGNPQERKHVFLSDSLRQRAPP